MLPANPVLLPDQHKQTPAYCGIWLVGCMRLPAKAAYLCPVSCLAGCLVRCLLLLQLSDQSLLLAELLHSLGMVQHLHPSYNWQLVYRLRSQGQGSADAAQVYTGSVST